MPLPYFAGIAVTVTYKHGKYRRGRNIMLGGYVNVYSRLLSCTAKQAVERSLHQRRQRSCICSVQVHHRRRHEGELAVLQAAYQNVGGEEVNENEQDYYQKSIRH